MYEMLDKFFFVFHTALIIFNMFGWAWKKTRRANLVVLLLTVLSWFLLGICYGFGYCPSTDWHWQVRMKLGHYEMPPSYLSFLIQSLTGFKVKKSVVDIFAVIFLFSALAASIWTNFRARPDSDKLKSSGVRPL
jgi:hypothetical protein